MLSPSRIWNTEISRWLVTARLKNSFSILEAQARVDAVMEQIHKENPSEPDYRSHLNALKTELVGASQHDLLLLLSAVCCLTLMICVNLGNLILGRNFARQRELSIRAALGASRTQLIAHSLAETSLLGLLGGVMGWLAAN